MSKPGTFGGAIPADDISYWRRNAVRFGQLDDLARRLQRLESAMKKKEEGGDEP